MSIYGKVIIFCDLLLKPFNVRIFKLNNLAALCAYKVVVVLVVFVYDLKARTAFAKFSLLRNAAFT